MKKLFQNPDISLDAIFAGAEVFCDQNQDGLADALDLQIVVQSGLCDSHIWAALLNLSARLSFEVLALDLPFVHTKAHDNTPLFLIHKPGAKAPALGNLEPSWAELRHSAPNKWEAYGKEPQALAALLNLLATAWAGEEKDPFSWSCLQLKQNRTLRLWDSELKECLELSTSTPPALSREIENRPESQKELDCFDLTGDRGIYTMPGDDPRARFLDLGISLPEKGMTCRLGLSLCHWLSRAVLECTDLKLPLARVGAKDLDFRQLLEILPEKDKEPELAFVDEPNSPYVVRAGGNAAGLARMLVKWADLGFSQKGPLGEGALKFRQKVADFEQMFLGEGYWGAWAHGLCLGDAKAMPVVPKGLLRWFENPCQLLSLPLPEAADPLPVLKRRSTWSDEIERLRDLAENIRPGEGKVLLEAFASKPQKERSELGVLLERLLREKGYEPKVTVYNSYKPGFSWLMEEVLPNLQGLTRVAGAKLIFKRFDKENCLELSSRWLEECFPAPDLLARSLGKPDEWVEFCEEIDPGCALRFVALDEKGGTLWQGDFSPLLTNLPYFGGKSAYPSTSGLRLCQNGRVIWEEALPSDREKFWRIFRERWLPELEKRMEMRLQSEDHKGHLAFWQEIRLEVGISESDIRLGLNDERICPMEAMHEDLYFGLLAFFREFSKKHNLDPATQLGRVAPVVYSRIKGHKPYAALKARPLVGPQSPVKKIPSSLKRNKLLLRQGKWLLLHEFDYDPDLIARFNVVAWAWGHDALIWRKGIGLKLTAPPNSDKKSVGSSSCPEPPADRLLPKREVDDWIKCLGGLPNFSAWQAGRTWQGRKVWALEAVLRPGGSLASQARSRLAKPTFLFNARHHANEISSTNAALRLAHFLGTTQRGREILKKVNVVFIPLENADGVATLEELLPGAEDHKLHAARYNALGVEYYAEYYENPPRFPDALAKADLWKRWLPRLCLDAHGVPSHEWDQPFAGLAPAGFQEFWLPRTMVFAYIPHIEDEKHPAHPGAKSLGRALANAFDQEKDIKDLNSRLADRYHRYARNLHKDVFPPSQGESLTLLPVIGRIQTTNLAMRKPQVTPYEVITEVTDELASGKLLELSVRAHGLAAEVMINDLLHNAEKAMKYPYSEWNGVYFAWRCGNLS
jgi:hypothetical protein